MPPTPAVERGDDSISNPLADRTMLFWRSGLPPHSPYAYLFAALCVALATTVRLAFGQIGLESSAFAPYYAATLIVALLAGWGAASLCAVASGICAVWLFILPEMGQGATLGSTLVSVCLYSISCVIIIGAAESYRRIVRELRTQELHRKLLADELAHRVKNTLAVVQSIIRHSVTDDPELREKLCSRIAALARTNEHLIRSGQSTSFHALVRSELDHFEGKVRISGPDFSCDANTSVLLSLAIHELATNAAKYGALSASHGKLAVAWSIEGGELMLDWRESGVEAIPASPGAGFGSKLLQSVASRLKGRVEHRFEPDGLICMLRLRLEQRTSAAPGASGSALPIPPAELHTTKA